MKTPREQYSKILNKTKNVAKHGNIYNLAINSQKSNQSTNQMKRHIGSNSSSINDNNTILAYSYRNKMCERSLSNSLIRLPYISNTIFIQEQDSMMQKQQQRAMIIRKIPKKKNLSERRFHNEIFNKTIFSNLLYEDNLIFHRKAHYQSLIKEQINYFKRNKNDNLTEILQQVIIDKDNVEMEIVFTSLRVKFNNEQENISFDFILPFALLPVYYSLPFNKFTLLLCGLVKFNETFDSIIINEGYIYQFLNHEFSSENGFNSYNTNYNNQIEIEDPKRVLIQKSKAKAHVHIFNWLTPLRYYKVSIIEPLINLTVIKNHIKFNKYIDYELLFYLYEKKFGNWEFYVINYLFSYKKVRCIFDKLLSKTSIKKMENMSINIHRDYIDDYSSYDTENDYISTDNKHETRLYRMKGGYINLMYNYFGSIDDFKCEYEIKFSISQMKMLLKMSMKYNQFNALIKRFITVKPSYKCVNISFDYDAFDAFSIESFNEEGTNCLERDNDLQMLGNDFYTIMITCGMIEVYSKQENNGHYLLSESIELAKDNTTASLFEEKNWKNGQAIISIQQQEVLRNKKKQGSNVISKSHSYSSLKGKKNSELVVVGGSRGFKKQKLIN